MRAFTSAIRLGTGGAALGVFLGIFLGGLGGTVYGFFVDNLEYGLNGALLGAAILGVIGAMLGMATVRQEMTEFTSFSSSDRTPATAAR